MKALYFKTREKVRLNSHVARAVYFAQSLVYSNFGAFRAEVKRLRKIRGQGRGVALCCRIRDEALFLREFIEYYRAAGVRHIFFYEKLSTDDFQHVLAPYLDEGFVTLQSDWPQTPVSPSAEHDCVLRCLGRYEWVGFIDADEFVVVKNGDSIEDFLSEYDRFPAVALHWRMYGSNGHKLRPPGPVIVEYTRRQSAPNRHVKCFIRPELAARCRNSHSWYFQGMKCAVTELGKKVTGSFSLPASAKRAWINHYHHKSDQDYFEKAARKSVLDTVGIRFRTRTLERHADAEKTSNCAVDTCASEYYIQRRTRTGLRADLQIHTSCNSPYTSLHHGSHPDTETHRALGQTTGPFGRGS